MKKTILLTIFVLVLMAFSTTTFAHTEDAPFRTDLIAGQDMDVGDVLVWNDETNLYVKFELTGDWCLLETHVAVGGSAAEIPQTKKENPIPGKFMYTASYSNPPCEQSTDPYVIPLEWEYGDEIAIAAHASVARPIAGCYERVWQIGDVEVENATTGWLENYADEFNWGDPAGPITAGPSLAVEQPVFTDPFIVGTTPIAEFPYNSNFNLGYATNFDVQWMGSLPFGGKLSVSWSPGQSATEKKVVSDGFGTETLTAIGTPTAGGFLNKYPKVEHQIIVDPLSDGTHTINFQHTQGDGTFWDWIRLEKVCEQHETGWGNGEQFDGSNWGMYFTYTVQAPPSCPSITGMSSNIEVLGSPPSNIRDDSLEDSTNFRVWKEFEGTLTANLAYDLEAGRSAKFDGPGVEFSIPAGEAVCVYYVHFDQVGESYTEAVGSLDFSADISGLIISGGNLGTFAGRNFMFAADDTIGYAGTTYPTMVGDDYLRGFDVNWSINEDDAEFNGSHVDFTMWVANAHDSMRVILPLVP